MRRYFSFLLHAPQVLHLGTSNDIRARSRRRLSEIEQLEKNRSQPLADLSHMRLLDWEIVHGRRNQVLTHMYSSKTLTFIVPQFSIIKRHVPDMLSGFPEQSQQILTRILTSL